MITHTLDGAYSDSGSQVLWEDRERVFLRGWRLDDNGIRHAVLIVLPAVGPPVPLKPRSSYGVRATKSVGHKFGVMRRAGSWIKAITLAQQQVMKSKVTNSPNSVGYSWILRRNNSASTSYRCLITSLFPELRLKS
jgi:hypothetical protein